MKGDVLVSGAARGRVMTLKAPISFWGGVDPTTGDIIDARHPDRGKNIAGKVMGLSLAIGSSSASSVLLELVRVGRAPAAILIAEPDAILLLGLIVAREMGWPAPPALKCAPALLQELDGRDIAVADDGAISIV